VVGQHAGQVACAMGADVFIGGIDQQGMHKLKKFVLPEASFFLSNKESIQKHVIDADLVVGAVLCRGAKAPKIISEEMIRSMSEGSVVVDVSIDQGGCIETSRPTTHSDPVFIKHGVVHYCVTNMPGAYPKTSTIALVDVTLPYIAKIADAGHTLLKSDQQLAKAINVFDGKITCKAVAEGLGMMNRYQPLN
jgi:alanine dehydrogenase